MERNSGNGDEVGENWERGEEIWDAGGDRE